jgi:hypothetical protein
MIRHDTFDVLYIYLKAKVGNEMPQIRNNTRKVYSLRLVPVVPLCGLQIEVIEGFRKGLM